MKYIVVLITALMTFGLVNAKTANELAGALVAEHDRNMAIWEAKFDQAPSLQAKQGLVAKRPKTKLYADAVLKNINPHLDKDWVVKYMAWLVRNHPNLVIEKTGADGEKRIVDREKIFMEYVERYHIYSMDAGVFVASLVYSERLDAQLIKEKRALAEKVYLAHANKHPEVMGAAAFACGHFVPPVDSDPELKSEIGRYYKTAVVHANDVMVGNRKIGDLVAEKVYVMNTLGNGSPVILFKGYDATQQPINMSDYKGKTVVLCFWSQNMDYFGELVKQLNKFKQTTSKHGIELLGITRDEVGSVRKLIGQGDIQWRSLIDVNGAVSFSYRVTDVPYCYIISEKGEIIYSGVYGGPLFGSVIAQKMK